MSIGPRDEEDEAKARAAFEREVDSGEDRVEHPPDLTPEDDEILDGIWDKIGQERTVDGEKS